VITFDQLEFDIRFEWGEHGVTTLAPISDVVIIVDVLSFSTSVELPARRFGRKFAVIAAGERWKDDGSLRPSFEDMVGAGAIISWLAGAKSPEATAAEAAFRDVESKLSEALRQCSSGKELIAQGFANDVILASELNVSECAPVLIDDAYRSVRGL